MKNLQSLKNELAQVRETAYELASGVDAESAKFYYEIADAVTEKLMVILDQEEKAAKVASGEPLNFDIDDLSIV